MGKSVNGIDVSSLEYRELESLVKSENPKSIAAEKADAGGSMYDMNFTRIYQSLRDNGLIEGRDNHGCFILDSVNPAGIAFVYDCEEQERERKKDRNRELFIAFGGTILGGVLTVIGSVVTKLLTG